MGCGRSLEEINDWRSYTDTQREEKIKECKKRLNILNNDSSNSQETSEGG